MLTWKQELQAVMDNPDYIEENIKAVQEELKHERPNTEYLRSKIRNMELWTHEIDLAADRARERAEMVV